MTVDRKSATDNISPNHKVALQFAALGVKVFPCRSSDGPPGNDGHPQWRAKSPMPRIKWTVQATTDKDIINAWWEAAPDALVGMPLEPLGYVVLDPDRHPGGPDGVAAYHELAKTYPGLTDGPYVETPQGWHYFFKQPVPPLGNAEGNLPPGINVRGKGGYVIAPGSVLPDGKTWELHGNLAAAHGLPLPILAMIRGTASETKADDVSYDDAELAFDFDDLTLPPDPRQAAYMLASCRNAYGKLSTAKAGSRNETLNTQALKLGHFIPRFLVEREIVHMLREACIVNGLAQDDGQASVDASIRSGMAKGKSEPHDPFDVAAEFWEADDNEAADATATSAPTDRIWKGSELGDIERTRFLIDGMVPIGALGLMVGESQTFKSFMAQSMALAIAAGFKDWQGHAITAPPGATVLYIAGEGGIESAAVRMRAWAIHNGIEIAKLDNFRLIPWSINLMDRASLRQLTKACKAQIETPLALIVIDTLNTSTAGADENSTQDMGTLYAVMRKLSSLFSTAIMGVHHTNKRGGTRGSNLLTQNADFTLFLNRPQRAWLTMNVELVVSKLKDAPSGASEHYHMDLVALADGSTSLTPKRIGSIQAERTETTASGRPSSRADAILTVLRNSRNIDGETPSEICKILDITEMKEKNAVAQALRRMLAQGVVIRDGNKWQIVEANSFFE